MLVCYEYCTGTTICSIVTAITTTTATTSVISPCCLVFSSCVLSITNTTAT